MSNGLIHQHKLLAEGKDVDVGGEGCESAFGHGVALHGGEEISKKRSLHDGKRGLKHLGRVADHGEHGMHTSDDGDSDYHLSKPR
jgi:hypothetical protein